MLKNIKNGYIDIDRTLLVFEEANLLRSFTFFVRSIRLSRSCSREGKFQGKTNRVEPIVVGLTADSDDDEGIPQRNFNSNTPVRSPVRVDITSDSGSDEPSLSTAPGKTSRVHTTPRSILDRNFYLAQAASKELYPWQRQRQKERPQQQRP
ncbi:hypothetical protein NA56DRAFT_652419 [Hyaloscypha hepaticicola]|uniref:Uncharacterized protein n=1 Tax=Hyaloscypha hepaticicola TaxID=2082293 RepID=A0A2J6PEN6_9HELO|nr:hypothetical protein NA56DRAFT_652419 [Hyaloscypha hepaticicola]